MQSWSEHKVDCEKCEKTGEDVWKKKKGIILIEESGKPERILQKESVSSI